MTEAAKKKTVLDGIIGVAKFGAGLVAGVFLIGKALAAVGVVSTIIGLGAATAVAGGLYEKGVKDGSFLKGAKDIFPKIVNFYKKSWADAREGFGLTKAYAEAKAPGIIAEVRETTLDGLRSASEFAKAAKIEIGIDTTATKPAPKVETLDR